MSDLTDAELDAWVLTRLRLIGIDLSVLPDDDPAAPADRRRILASARRMLRTTVPAISDFPLDPQDVPPVMYPAAFAALPDDGADRAGGAE